MRAQVRHGHVTHDSPQQVAAKLYPFKDEPHQKMDDPSSQYCCTWKMSMNVGKAVLGLAIIILLIWLTRDENSSLNKWQNTKSMHAADSMGSLAWVALLPGQVYLERGELYQEYTIQADRDNAWEREAYGRKLLLAGGANILTNISSNVYVLAILLIYFLSLFDVKGELIERAAKYWAGDTETKEETKEKQLTILRLICWGTWVISVLVYLFLHYSVWYNETWKTDLKGAKGLTIKYQYDYGGSEFYAMAVVAMYIWFINYRSYHLFHHTAEKYDTYSAVASAFFFADCIAYYREDKIKIIFTICFFLVVMALLGQSRDIILETETQICLLSTVAFCFLTILTMRVQRFFMFVESSLISRLKGNESFIGMLAHVQMTRFTFTVARIISIAVKILLFGVIVHVLYNLKVERTQHSPLWFYLVISTALFQGLEIWEVLSMFINKETDTQKTEFQTKIRYQTMHYFFLVFFLGAVLYLIVHQDQHKDLFLYETAQHAHANEGIKENSQCVNGIQKNNLTKSYLDQKIDDENDNKYSDLKMLGNSPIAFKLFAWTRWWTLEQILTSKYNDFKQDPDLYFCSTGFEQEFGLCRRQYTEKPGHEFRDADFKTAAETSIVTK
jgi:hypothetical protein